MQCAQCGHEIMAGTAFCPYCGERLAAAPQREDRPIYQTDVKGMRKTGTLVVYHDRTEFITSSVQKTVYNYSTLVSVKKRTGLGLGLDHIDFITEDGRTESCDVNRKNIHEAFLYIEQAVKPYIAERKKRLLSQGIRYSMVSSMGLTDGILNLSDSMAEFRAKSGQSEILSYEDVRSVRLSRSLRSETLEFSLTDGSIKAFGVEKDLQNEALSFVEVSLEPFIAARKAALLAQGIYLSVLGSYRSENGTLNLLADKAEFTARSGQQEVIAFQDVRTVALFADTLEISLTDGTSRSFTLEKYMQGEILSFIRDAIHPYVQQRTVGFDLSFGIDERIEINRKRGVFHILRQGGCEISQEYPLDALIRCEQTECVAPKSALGLLAGAAKAVGVQEKLGAPDADDVIRFAGVDLTICTGSDTLTESVHFGEFSLGMSRSNKKYDGYLAGISEFMACLENLCPECERMIPIPPEPETQPADLTTSMEIAVFPAAADNDDCQEETPEADATVTEQDRLGIANYIAGVSGFIGSCTAPMTIAVQGSWGSGRNSVMNMLSDSLAERYPDGRIWFNARALIQSDSEEPLPVLVGKTLIRQLSGADSSSSKDSAVKIAKGVIELLAGAIAPDSSAGQNLVEGLFRDGSAIPPEKLVDAFSRLIEKRAKGPDDKVIFLITELDKLAPSRAVALLDAMRNYFDCDGCVFVAAIDYSFFLRGVREHSGMDLDEEQEKALFDEIFQMTFRVPVSGYQTRNYVRNRLEALEIRADSEAELEFYVELIRNSVGCDPKSMGRLFNSLLLLKNIADSELYADRIQRLMLFALLCMQTSFHSAYDQLKQMRDQVTPGLLTGLCSEDSEVIAHSGMSAQETEAFLPFARVFCDIINTDHSDHISQAECSVFAHVLEVSSITSK